MPQHEYFAARTNDSVERDRLAALEAANDPKSIRHLTNLGVRDGWTCLEVGAGAGSIACWLSDRVGSEGHVLAIDVDTRFLRDIKRPNVEVRAFDVLDDGLESSKYDVTHCRFVLMHVSDPVLALRRMVDATRPGGWIVIEEPDFSSYRAADLNHPLGEIFTRKVRATFQQAEKSGLFDPYLGLRTRSLLEGAGLANVTNEGTAYLWRGGEAEAEEHLRSLSALVRARVCTDEDAADIAEALTDPTFTFVGHTMCSAWGQRTP